jgi:hypothetical protein
MIDEIRLKSVKGLPPEKSVAATPPSVYGFFHQGFCRSVKSCRLAVVSIYDEFNYIYAIDNLI